MKMLHVSPSHPESVKTVHIRLTFTCNPICQGQLLLGPLSCHIGDLMFTMACGASRISHTRLSIGISLLFLFWCRADFRCPSFVYLLTLPQACPQPSRETQICIWRLTRGTNSRAPKHLQKPHQASRNLRKNKGQCDEDADVAGHGDIKYVMHMLMLMM